MFIQKVASSVKSVEKFFRDCYRSSTGIAKVLLLSSFSPKIPTAKGSECVVLGNGPSLNKTLELYRDKIGTKSVMVVNFFANSLEFGLIKPDYYVMLDPCFFLNKNREDVNLVFDKLKIENLWDTILFIPHIYRNDKDVELIIINNSRITVSFYNYTIVKGFNWLSFFLYRKNLATPQFYNVLGISIYLGLSMDYKVMWLTGADHGWFNDLEVDELNNLCRRDYHFYDKDINRKAIPLIDPITNERFRISAFFEALYKVFDSYYILENYSKYRNCKIYNASEFSYIDAFERKKIE